MPRARFSAWASVEADQRIDELLEDLLGRAVRDFFDVHAAFGRGHHGTVWVARSVSDGNVIFVLDVGAFLDQQVAHLLALRAGLVGHQLHAEDVVGVLAHFVERAGELDTTALAAAAGVDLGLHHPDLAAEILGRLDRRHPRTCSGNRAASRRRTSSIVLLPDTHESSWLPFDPEAATAAAGANRLMACFGALAPRRAPSPSTVAHRIGIGTPRPDPRTGRTRRGRKTP